MVAAAAPAVPPVISDLLQQALTGGLKLSISGTFPGEALLVKILEVYMMVRGGMDKALVARWDAVTVQQVEDMQAVNRGIWLTLGVLKG